MTYLAAIYAIIKVPMLTSHIFSGTSGGSARHVVRDRRESASELEA